MTLFETISRIEQAAAKQPAVNMIVQDDVFKLNNCPDARYGVFAWTQGTHSAEADSDFVTYQFSLYYVDRLRDDLRNRLEVQSDAVQVLDNILRELSEEWGLEHWDFTTFSQRFTDQCAGAFCTVTVSVPRDGICSENFSGYAIGNFNYDFGQGVWTRSTRAEVTKTI